MPVWREWDLTVDADAVLRGQGADPAIIRGRSAILVSVAERAIREGSHLIKPEVLFRRLAVDRVAHERITLEGNGILQGKLLAQHLAPASEAAVILCTIGDDLETRASETMAHDPVFGLALDGLGSAYVEALANAACRRFEDDAKVESLQTSIPLSPGMIGWSVEEGQPQIFHLLPSEEIGVRVTASWVMLPRKSLSMVLGIGREMVEAGRTCDYCTLREACRYQDHYASR